MNENIFIALFVAIWSGGFFSQFVVKSRLKKLYPGLHKEVSAPSFSEHNIAYSLKYVGFSLKSSQWAEIEDQNLILWLQIQRALFIIMSLMMFGFLAVCLGDQV